MDLRAAKERTTEFSHSKHDVLLVARHPALLHYVLPLGRNTSIWRYLEYRLVLWQCLEYNRHCAADTGHNEHLDYFDSANAKSDLAEIPKLSQLFLHVDQVLFLL